MNAIVALESNFLFQLSLGSKELFHSNLLAWLLEQKNAKKQEEVFCLFLNKYGGNDFTEVKYGQISNIKIEREQGNMDLILKWSQDGVRYHIIIENKMKSIPSIEQLETYNEKIRGLEKNNRPSINKVVKKYLLTPFSIEAGNSLTNDGVILGWENITYANDILPFLQTIEGLSYDIVEVKLVIQKYIEFIYYLSDLIKKCSLDSYKKLKIRHYDFYESIIIDELRKVRMHDFILKLAHSYIAKLIIVEIRKDGNIKLFDTYEQFKKESKGVFVQGGFSRSTGLTDIKIHLGEKQLIGIQLQGNVLKYYVEIIESSRIHQNIEFAKKLLENKKWFFHRANEGGMILYGNGEDKSLTFPEYGVTFYSYSKKRFIYLSKDIKKISRNSHCTVQELVIYISEELNSVFREINFYKNLLKK